MNFIRRWYGKRSALISELARERTTSGGAILALNSTLEPQLLEALGLAVVRHIPAQALAGLLSGAYTLHGGVVRDAGGRIVAHLLADGPAAIVKDLIPGINVLAQLVGSGQLYSLARDVEEVRGMVSTVMAISTAAVAISGVGLVTSIAGTAFLSRRLDGVQSRLAHIERLLKDQHLAVLRGAVDNLRHAEHAADRETRKAMLVSAKTDFSKSAHFYGSQFADPRGPEEVLALDDSFTLATIGSALALSELGMYGAAAADFEDHIDRWRALARRHVGKYLLGDAPQRLLNELPVDELSAAEIVGSLDFVNGTQKSWGWIDELRRERSVSRGITLPSWGADKSLKGRIELARVLTAKDPVLDGFGEHLRLLDGKRLSVSGFHSAVEQARLELGAPAACVTSTPV